MEYSKEWKVRKDLHSRPLSRAAQLANTLYEKGIALYYTKNGTNKEYDFRCLMEALADLIPPNTRPDKITIHASGEHPKEVLESAVHRAIAELNLKEDKRD